MKKLLLLVWLIFLLVSCNQVSNHSVVENNCVANFFNDSILVTKNANGLIKVSTGKEVYATIAKTSNCLQPLLDDNNRLYTPISEEVFQCIDLNDKQVKWSFTAPELINNFKLFKDKLVISIRNYGLVVLNAATGTLLYELKEPNSSTCHTMLVKDFFVENGKLYVSDFRCSNVMCFDVENGNQLWQYTAATVGAAQLCIVKDYVFCGITGNPTKNEGLLVLLDKLTGQVKFTKPEKVDLITKPLIVDNKILYYSYDYKLNQLNIDNFTTKSLLVLDNLNAICGGQMYLIDASIYFTNCNFKLVKFNLEQQKLYELGNAPKSLTAVYKVNDEVKFVY